MKKEKIGDLVGWFTLVALIALIAIIVVTFVKGVEQTRNYRQAELKKTVDREVAIAELNIANDFFEDYYDIFEESYEILVENAQLQEQVKSLKTEMQLAVENARLKSEIDFLENGYISNSQLYDIERDVETIISLYKKYLDLDLEITFEQYMVDYDFDLYVRFIGYFE